MRKIKVFVVLAMVLALMACATIGVKPYSEMSPKEKVTFLFSLYNKQYEDYKVQAAKPNLTELERSILVSKKKIFGHVYPILQALDLAFVEGRPWDKVNEQNAINMLRQLGAKI